MSERISISSGKSEGKIYASSEAVALRVTWLCTIGLLIQSLTNMGANIIDGCRGGNQ